MTTQPAAIAQSSFASTDPDTVSQTCVDLFGGHVSIAAGEQPWKLAITNAEAAAFAVTTVDLPVNHAFGVQGRDELVVETVRRGKIQISGGAGEHRYRAGDVFLGNFPDADHHGRSVDGRFHLVTLSGGLLRRVAGLDEGAPLGVASDLMVPGAAGRWTAAVELADEVLTSPVSVSSPLALDSIGRVFAAAALALLPTNAPPSTSRTDSRDAHPGTLRRAVEFIEAHPASSIGLADIARAAAASPRAVQLAFRRHLATTPTAYLRRIRLDGARSDLASLGATGEDAPTTIAKVAARWGYLNVDTFSAHYRDAYGEPPDTSSLES